jgi:hypothetical protein
MANNVVSSEQDFRHHVMLYVVDAAMVKTRRITA